MYISHDFVFRKPENILEATRGPRRMWKLCDFGSAVRGTSTPANEEQRAQLQNDIEKKTSLSYRAPEMLDLFRGSPIGAPADVWALGVTMFYATWLVQPFQDGELAILNGRFQFPSARGCINGIISSMLQQEPEKRPLAHAVHTACERGALAEVAQLAGTAPLPSPRTIAVGSPRVSNPSNVKRVAPADTALAQAVKAATEEKSDADVHVAKPSSKSDSPRADPPSRSPAAVPAESNERLLAEAKRCLADIKVLKDPDAWRLEIAAEVQTPTTARDVTVKAYKTAQRPFVASKSRVTDLFGLVRQFALPSNAAEVFQMLSIFHLALQSGSYLACAGGFTKKSFLDEVAAQDGDVIGAYATFLAEKVSFHNAHRFVEGNMSMGTFAMIWQLNQLRTGLVYSDGNIISGELLHAALALLDRAVVVEGRLLAMRENASIALFLIPVTKETFSIAVLLGHLVRGRHVPRPISVGFATALQTLKSHYEVVNTIPVLVQAMGSAPDLALVTSGSFPPSHSPFVAAYLEKQRFANAAPSAALPPPQQFATNFDAHFPPAAEAAHPPMAQPQPQLAAPKFDAPSFVIPQGFDAPRFPVDHPAVAATASVPATPPPAAVVPVATASSPVPSAIKEERLRKGNICFRFHFVSHCSYVCVCAVGSRRGSVRDISQMREATTKDMSDLALSRGLDGMNREQLIEEVVELRRKVATLEEALTKVKS